MTEPAAAATQLALEFVRDGQTLGLGTGRAASAFVRALGERVAHGLQVRGVATSDATAALAREVDVPLVSLAEARRIDVTFDGADEVDPQLDLIKGYGGALVREKIVAASSQELVILVGEEKLVSQLGSRGVLPVEVLPFAQALCEERLRELGCEPVERLADSGAPFRNDNANAILDCKIAPIENAAELDRAIREIPGAIGSGLFVAMADTVVVEGADGAELRTRPTRSAGDR